MSKWICKIFCKEIKLPEACCGSLSGVRGRQLRASGETNNNLTRIQKLFSSFLTTALTISRLSALESDILVTGLSSSSSSSPSRRRLQIDFTASFQRLLLTINRTVMDDNNNVNAIEEKKAKNSWLTYTKKLHSIFNMESGKLNIIKTFSRNFFSELIGTAILVFLGCLGVSKGLGQEGDHTGVVLSFAFAVFISVQITCHNSGGHVNPAVTVLSLFFKRLSIPMAAVYICGQLFGGIIGFGILKAIIPSHLFNTNDSIEFGLCSTVPNPNLTVMQAVLTEFFLTSILLLIVCSAWDPRNIHHDSLTIKFGFTIYSLAYAGVAYTGCSMNPARSLGPAIWNQTWKHHWIYWVGPLLSALFCGFFYTNFFCPTLPPPQKSSNKSEVKDELEMNL